MRSLISSMLTRNDAAPWNLSGAGLARARLQELTLQAKRGDAFAINLSFRGAQSWRLLVASRERRLVFQLDARQISPTRLAA